MALLLVGRAVLGAAESLIITGSVSWGLALGLYTACLDVAMGFGSPALGWIAGHAGLASVFAVSALVVLSADVIALRLWRNAPQRLHS